MTNCQTESDFAANTLLTYHLRSPRNATIIVSIVSLELTKVLLMGTSYDS